MAFDVMNIEQIKNTQMGFVKRLRLNDIAAASLMMRGLSSR